MNRGGYLRGAYISPGGVQEQSCFQQDQKSQFQYVTGQSYHGHLFHGKDGDCGQENRCVQTSRGRGGVTIDGNICRRCGCVVHR